MSIVALLQGYRRAVSSALELGNCNLSAAVSGVLYARLVLGRGPLYYSLFSFFKTPVKDWASFMLDTESNETVRKINSPDAQRLVTDKLEFYLRLRSLDLPTIPVLAVISRNREKAVERESQQLREAEDFSRVANNFPPVLFFKLVDGAHGYRAFSATRVQGNWAFDGRHGNASDLYEYCMARVGESGGWLVQPRISPHPCMVNTLAPRALATVRIVTVLRGSDVQVLAAALKIPVGESETDNFSEGASGNVIAPVDFKTGELGQGVMSRSRSWPEMIVVDRHPDTGCNICGFQLPFWKETLQLVERAQREFQEAPTLGWDIALTENGPVIVEANAGYSVEIHQVAEQRGLRNKFAPAYDSLISGSVAL